MTVTRRRLFGALAVTFGYGQAGRAADPEISLEALRNVSTFDGIKLRDERLRVITKVLRERLSRLETFRNFEIDDAVAPTPGILR